MKPQENNKKEEFKRRLYKFVLELIRFINSLPRDLTVDVIAKQLLRSGTSILGNYIEAIYSYSKKEFSSYLQICLRSTKESAMWISLLKDSGKISGEKTVWLLNELTEFGKIFSSSIMTIKSKNRRLLES